MSKAPQRHHLIRTCVRGLQNRCPNCGQRTLFEEGRFFRVAHTCRNCDLPIDRGGGFFLGPVALNYGFVAFGIVGPLILLGVMGIIPVDVAVVIGVIGALLFPILLYRFSWSVWVAGFYAFFPELLTASGREAHDDPEF